jgi:phosphoribosylformimino-5-aminoimidazole carboxamide ribonucleotide (ProFAR) isomerase
LLALRDLGLPNLVGAVTGRAVYDGRLDLARAVHLLNQPGGA